MSAQGIRAGRAYVEIGTNLSNLDKGLRQAQAKLKAFGKSVSDVGQSMLKAGTIAATPIALSTVVFASFEQKMSRVKALTNATTEDFDRLRNKAKELGASTVFSASQAADAMSFFALAGYDTETILKAIGPTLDLAATGQIEIAQAADIAAKVMAGMGISADQLGNTIDVMAKAMTTANTDLNMLGEAFKFVGPMAKTAGISLEEITAGIQLLSNAGVQGEMAGTTLRGMILSLTAPSAEAKKKMEELGIQVADSQGNFRGLIDIIADLEKAMEGKGSAEKLEDLGIIFPARQAAGAAELVAQGAEKFRTARDALLDSGGTAARIANTQLDNLAGDAVILTSALEGLAISVGEALAPAFRRMTQYVSTVVSNLINFVSANQMVIATIATVIGVVAAAGAALVAVGAALKIAAFATGTLTMAVGGLSKAYVLLLSPIGLVSTLAAAAFLSWTTTGQGMLDSINTSISGIVAALKAGRIEVAMQIAMTGLQAIVAEAMQGISSTFGISIKSMMSGIADLRKSWAKAVADAKVKGDKIGTGIGSASARVDLKIAQVNAQERHRRAGTIGSEEYQREMERYESALNDVGAYADQSHENAKAEIMAELEKDLADIDKSTNDWANALNPELLRQKIADLRHELDKPPVSTAADNTSRAQGVQNVSTTEMSGGYFGAGLALALNQVQTVIKSGLLDAQKFETTGTFSAEQAARFGSGRENIPKQQLEELKGINKHVKRTADKRGGTATP